MATDRLISPTSLSTDLTGSVLRRRRSLSALRRKRLLFADVSSTIVLW
jgi:hypothetical protein